MHIIKKINQLKLTHYDFFLPKKFIFVMFHWLNMLDEKKETTEFMGDMKYHAESNKEGN